MGGFIKLDKDIEHWGWYSDLIVKSVFLDILIHTNYADGEFKGVEIKRGQAVIGRKAMAKRLGISEQNVRTALKKLQSTGEIKLQKPTNKSTNKSTNLFTLVTVVKWEVYQGWYDSSNQESNLKVTKEQPKSNQRVTASNKNNKKNKNNINNNLFNEWVTDDWLNQEVPM